MCVSGQQFGKNIIMKFLHDLDPDNFCHKFTMFNLMEPADQNPHCFQKRDSIEF